MSSSNDIIAPSQVPANRDAGFLVRTRASWSARLHHLALHVPAAALVIASTGFGCVFAWGQGQQTGVALAVLSVLMTAGLELAKPLSIAAAFAPGTPGQTRLALGLLAAVAIAYSLSAEISLVAVNRQAANSGRAATATAHTVAQADLDAARADLAALGNIHPVAEAEQAFAVFNLNKLYDQTKACTAATLPASRDWCVKATGAASELVKAKKAEALRSKIETAQSVLVASAGVTEADPGAAATSAYLGSLGLHIDPDNVAKLLVLLAVLALEVGSATAGLLVAASARPVLAHRPATLGQPAAPPKLSVAMPDSARPLTADSPAPEGGNSALSGPDSTGQSVRERLFARLAVAGGSLAQSTRELALGLGCSKSALADVLTKLETEGLIVRVAASHGKGSAIRLATATAA